MLRKNTLSLLILGLCAAMFGYMAWIRGNEALWNDEIYTLQYFVLKGLPSVLTDYHVPNNHILSNILHWGWLKLLGIQEIGSLLDHCVHHPDRPRTFTRSNRERSCVRRQRSPADRGEFESPARVFPTVRAIVPADCSRASRRRWPRRQEKEPARDRRLRGTARSRRALLPC